MVLGIPLALTMSGTVLMVTGWFWSLAIARNLGTRWLIGVALFFFFTLPFLAYQHWDRAKRPFFATVIGAFLTYGTSIFTTDA